MMSRFTVLLLLLLSILISADADTLAGPAYPSPDYASLKPSLAVVIGILTVMFVLTFLLLVYAKFCHGPRRDPEEGGGGANNPAAVSGSSGRFSGIDKTVVESLPFFRFSSLKGSREGLECAVCLSKFEDVEVLRLLPKCKHAFHIDCIDHWLERHSTCPLCRRRVGSEDLKLVSYSTRFGEDDPSGGGGGGSTGAYELFVQREESRRGGSFSSRFSIGSSFRKIENHETREQEEESSASSALDRKDNNFHRHNHKIVASEFFAFKQRWSNVTSSDLMFLSSEMLNRASSDRFPPAAAEIGNSSWVAAVPNNTTTQQTRSVSEITAVPRNRIAEPPEEERIRRVWLRIARRTVQWFANRQHHHNQPHQTHSLDV